MGENPYVDEHGRPLVAITESRDDLGDDIERVLEGLGGLEQLLSPDDRILIKPNINSEHDAPAAVDPEFLTTFIDLLRAQGYPRLAVAESSGRSWAPTARVMEEKGLLPLLEERDVPFFNLDDAEFEEVETGGEYLPRVHLPLMLREYDRLIFLPNLKTHGNAGFTLTIKLAMGLTPQSDRDLFHRTSVPGAVVDLARVVRPDLSVIDGRTAFVEGGPTFGTLAEPGVILASGDPVACDVEGARILIQSGAEGHLGVSDPWETETIRLARPMLSGEIQVRWV